jgi:hypothetical protein
VSEGDTYHYPLGVGNQREALEDSERIEIKFFPEGNAIEFWNQLVGSGPRSRA